MPSMIVYVVCGGALIHSSRDASILCNQSVGRLSLCKDGADMSIVCVHWITF